MFKEILVGNGILRANNTLKAAGEEQPQTNGFMEEERGLTPTAQGNQSVLNGVVTVENSLGGETSKEVLITDGGKPAWDQGAIVAQKPLPKETETEMKKVLGYSAKLVCNGDMDEYDRAVEVEDDLQIGKNPIWNKEVLELEDRFGRRLFAWITRDRKGKNIIEAYQLYSNGKFSEKLQMEQGNVLMTAFACYTTDKDEQKSAKRYISEIKKEYGDKFRGNGREFLDIKETINMLAAQLNFMPTYKNDLWELEKEEFYKEVLKHASYICMNDFGHKDYYPLDRDDLQYVAESMNLNRMTLLEKLDKFGLLYLPKSSKGYQTNVRFDCGTMGTHTEWRYCIWRDKELEKRMEEERKQGMWFYSQS